MCGFAAYRGDRDWTLQFCYLRPRGPERVLVTRVQHVAIIKQCLAQESDDKSAVAQRRRPDRRREELGLEPLRRRHMVAARQRPVGIDDGPERRGVRTVGVERFVLGTGQPLRIPENAIAKLDLLDLPQPDRTAVESGNARRLAPGAR